jgi:hypothetical protein
MFGSFIEAVSFIVGIGTQGFVKIKIYESLRSCVFFLDVPILHSASHLLILFKLYIDRSFIT